MTKGKTLQCVELDNAFTFLRQTQFFAGAEHALALNTTHLGNFYTKVAGKDCTVDRTGNPEPCSGIGGSADNLPTGLTFVDANLADLKSIGIGMALCRFNEGDFNASKRRR